jgi:hypothetical protein
MSSSVAERRLVLSYEKSILRIGGNLVQCDVNFAGDNAGRRELNRREERRFVRTVPTKKNCIRT